MDKENASCAISNLTSLRSPFNSGDDNDDDCGAEETEVLERKPAPVPPCSLQIPHNLTGDRTGAAKVGNQQEVN
jgi:hypothetical protein